MATSFMSRWHKFQDGTPGRRFRDRYEKHRRKHADYPWIGRIVRLILAIGALAIGFVLMFIPGPAILFFLIAGTLLASDSLAIAKLLDVIEVRLRKILRWARQHWKRIPTYGKVLVCCVALASSAACTYIAYRFVW